MNFIMQQSKPMVRQFDGHIAERAAGAAIVQKVKRLISSKDPRVQAVVKAAQQEILSCKLLTPNQVHQEQTLTTLSIRYSNASFIGTQIMPVKTVNSISGRFLKYSKRDRLGLPDASIGQRATPNEISEGRTWGSYLTEPFALMDFLDDRLIRIQDAPLDEMSEMVAAVNDVLDLLEEIRIAAKCMNPSNFAGNTDALTGADKWTDPSSDPIGVIETAINSLWTAPGADRLIGVTNPEVMTALRNHPQFVERFKYTQAGGKVSNQQIAAMFGLDDILIGGARKDVANEGQTADYQRVWGNHFLIARVNPNPGLKQATFGMTWRFGQKITTQWFDPMPGISGGYYAKVGMEESHDIIAPDLGYLWTDVI